MTVFKAKDFSYLYSEETKSRKPSHLKTCIHYFQDPNVIFLGGGLPMSDYFPWDNLNIESPLPPFKNGIRASPSGDEADTCKVKIMKNEQTMAGDTTNIPLARSLQYGFSQGQPEFLSFVREHTKLIHDVPYEDWDVIATVGNTNAWESTLRIFCNKGDNILAESYAFSSSLSAAEAQGINVFPVPLDSNGIIPEKLEQILENWTPEATMPKLLYTVPTGQNPTGSCLPLDRKKAIYKIAQKYDFIIIEDEPYYFLQMEPYVKDPSKRINKTYSDHNEFIQSLSKSFISIDTEGRVIRLDSLSKVLAPGARLGWIVGSKEILKTYLFLHEMTIQSPSGFAQSIVAGTLNSWGQKGFLDWLIGLRQEYTHKRDVTIDALYKYLPQESFITINPPIAGMFFTINIDASAHPEFDTIFESNPEKMELSMFERIISRGVLVAPGLWFKTNGDTQPPQPKKSRNVLNPNEIFYRGTYAAVPLEKLEEGISRLGNALHEEFGIQRGK